MTDTKPTAEEGLRSILEDFLIIGTQLSPYCKTVEELIAMCKHALENEAQLRLILKLTTQKR